MYKIIDLQDDFWIHGCTIFEDGRKVKWIAITDKHHETAFWMLYPPYRIFQRLNLNINEENSNYLQKIWEDNWVEGVYFFTACCVDIKDHANDVAKIIINDLSSIANELGIHVSRVLECGQINDLAKAVFSDKKVDKKHIRAISERLMAMEPLTNILDDPAFAKADTSFIDKLIKETLSENGDKFDGSDKMINWLIGQIMKKSKGKADAIYIRNRLKIND